MVVLGLVFGSFVNAWVWRTAHERSVAKGRSICPNCKHQLAWYDLIPVLSWVSLRGKCRYCSKHISIQYPTVEILTAILFAALYWLINPITVIVWLELILLLAITVLLMAAFVYDARYMLLPEKFMLPAAGLGVMYLGLQALNLGWLALGPQLIALAIVLMLYTALWYFSKGKWLGAGDIRIVAVMGLLLAPKQLIVGLIAAYVIGAAWGVYLILAKDKTRKSKMAFGPFLIIGLYFGLFFGLQIANWYLSLI